LAEGAAQAARRAERARLAVALAAARLLDGTASADGLGLMLRGQEERPRTLAGLAVDDSPVLVAADGLVRLAHLSEELMELLGDHPDAAVRRAAASLAARAYPLLTGLEVSGDQAPSRPRRADGGGWDAVAPDDPAWLGRLVDASPLLADSMVRRHWVTLLPVLDAGERYRLASALLEVERQLPTVTMARGRRAVQAWERWRQAAGPWARFGQCLPLLGAGLDEIAQDGGTAPESAISAEATNTETIAVVGAIEGVLRDGPTTLVVLDAAPVTGVLAARRLFAAGLARPLLILGRWPAADAVLPAQPLVATLIACARGLRDRPAPHVVLVLDGERQTPLPGRAPSDPSTDNRFELDPNDLPQPADLHFFQVARVALLRAPNARTRDPVANYERAGLEVVRASLPPG
jgi:hypothetical protein